jgi:hypothetical protein
MNNSSVLGLLAMITETVFLKTPEDCILEPGVKCNGTSRQKIAEMF